jgi:hypothetical protein
MKNLSINDLNNGVEMKLIATIQLDNDLGKGTIFYRYEENDYFSDRKKAYVIYVLLPSGEVIDPAVAPQRNIPDVFEAITLCWYDPSRKLEFIQHLPY